jgi:hypothetical protein
MIRAKDFFINGNRTLIEYLCLLVLALGYIEVCQEFEVLSIVGFTNKTFTEVKCSLEEYLCLLIVTLGHIEVQVFAIPNSVGYITVAIMEVKCLLEEC